MTFLVYPMEELLRDPALTKALSNIYKALQPSYRKHYRPLNYIDKLKSLLTPQKQILFL